MELVLTFLFSLVAPGLRILQDFAGFCRLILLKFFRVSTGWATQGRGLRIWVAEFFRRFGSRILRGFARQRRAECAFLCLVWRLGGFGAGDQTSVWRLVGQLWFSKSFCATRLKASAATVLSQRGAVGIRSFTSLPDLNYNRHLFGVCSRQLSGEINPERCRRLSSAMLVVVKSPLHSSWPCAGHLSVIACGC